MNCSTLGTSNSTTPSGVSVLNEEFLPYRKGRVTKSKANEKDSSVKKIFLKQSSFSYKLYPRLELSTAYCMPFNHTAIIIAH